MKKQFYLFLLLSAVGNKLTAQNYANTTLSNLTNPTAVNVNLLPDKNHIRNLGSVSKTWKNLYLDSAVYIDSTRFIAFKTGTGAHNTAVGAAALNGNTSGTNNTAAGFNALYRNTTGSYNTANGYRALFSNKTGTWNTAGGYQALFSNTTGFENTANGAYALYSNTTGENNTADGRAALNFNTTGNYNTATGDEALDFNTTGSYNTATGIGALLSNSTGNENTANGDGSLGFNITGSYNTATGEGALSNNITGSYNTATGEGALYTNEDGNSNTAFGANALSNSSSLSNLVGIGDSALYSLHGGSGHCTAVGSEAGWQNTTGSNNTYLGYHAGNTVTTGSSNTIIGYGADISSGALSNATAIGNLAVTNASNKVRIGNTSVTSIGGQVSWTTGSDERIKTNIKQNVPGLTFINLLKPVTYNYDVDKEDAINGITDKEKQAGKYDIQKIQFTGFLAQEVEKAAKQVNYDFSGVDVPKNDKDIYGLRYSDFVVPLVKAVQELSEQNDSLKNQNDAQQKINADQQKQIDDLRNLVLQIQQARQSGIVAASSTSTVQSTNIILNNAASLAQNVPNPFTNTTTIGYYLPHKFSSAQIVITDKNGNQLKQMNVTGVGKGTIHVDAATLASGAYQYSLYIDGRLIDTKQMQHIN